MAGGPVTGAFSGEQFSFDTGRVEKQYNGIIIPTVLRIAADTLSYFTSMTCLYNKYWYAEQDRVTLPISTFHVKKITETWQNETSKKRVILYEPSKQPTAQDLANPVREGVMQTIVDNIVKQPKTYSLEIIVPFQPIGRYITQGVRDVTEMITGILTWFGNDPAASASLNGALAGALAVIKTMGAVYDIAAKLPDTQGVSFMNKNSLEAMAESGKVLTMKMWTGYDYKYVVITGLTLEKNPLEDDVYRGTLQVQELPVLTITKPKDGVLGGITRGSVITTISKAQSVLMEPLVALTGVKAASDDATAWSDITKTMLGG
jgi:hypothetical protein